MSGSSRVQSEALWLHAFMRVTSRVRETLLYARSRVAGWKEQRAGQGMTGGAGEGRGGLSSAMPMLKKIIIASSFLNHQPALIF